MEVKGNHLFWNNWATLYNTVVRVLADNGVAVASAVPTLQCFTSLFFSFIHCVVPEKVESLSSQRPRILSDAHLFQYNFE